MSSAEDRKQMLQDQVMGRVDQFFETLTARLDANVKQTLRTCVTCLHFDGQREVCKQAKALDKHPGGIRPPARVIAFGCGHHEPDIPF